MCQPRPDGGAQQANMLTMHYTLKGRERNRDSQTARGGGSEVICVAPMLCSSIPTAPPDFSELLMFVISCITLEDSDWEKNCKNLYGTNIDNSWLLGIGEEEKMQTMLMNGN